MILLRIFKFQISDSKISDWGGEPVEPRYPQLSAVGGGLRSSKL
jgi:hypothetical protein